MFKRTAEDFTCEHCNVDVKGSGYTNHCPKCLWSKHVDVHPGDRAESCGGMMRPIAVEGTTARYRLLHQCERCGANRRVRLSDGDDMQAVLAIAGIE